MTIAVDCEGLTRRKIEFRGRDLTFYGPEHDGYFRDFVYACHTNNFFFHVAERLEPSSVIFDIGANVGFTTAVLSTKVPLGKVFSFEPSPIGFAALGKAISVNHLWNCTPYMLALSDKPGKMGFFNNPQSISASHLLTSKGYCTANVEVEVTTLDEFVSGHDLSRLNLIKLDVEGAEVQVLHGGLKTIAKFKPALFIEFNSYTLIAHGDINPRRLLEQLLTIYPHVYRYSDDKLTEIRNEASQQAFIHNNLVLHGCVDDLYCTFAPMV